MNVLSRFALVILNLMFLAGARAAVDPARSCLVVPKPVDYHLTGEEVILRRIRSMTLDSG